jgi:exosortase/archaeosortase family protein
LTKPTKKWLKRASAASPGGEKANAAPAHRRSALRPGRPVLRFVLLMIVFTVLFNAVFYLFIANSRAYKEYLHWNAKASAAIMQLFGEDVLASGTLLASSRNSVDIRRGCDALQVTAFFVFGVLASPIAVTWRHRLLVALLGAAFLLLVNLVRIISLYYAGLYSPHLADVMHVDVWQPAFIFLTIFLWLAWAWRALRLHTRNANAAG